MSMPFIVHQWLLCPIPESPIESCLWLHEYLSFSLNIHYELAIQMDQNGRMTLDPSTWAHNT